MPLPEIDIKFGNRSNDRPKRMRPHLGPWVPSRTSSSTGTANEKRPAQLSGRTAIPTGTRPGYSRRV